MHPDDELCLCFHVSWRKVINYIRIHRVRLPSQVTECQGAGTGCGWCRSSITRLIDRMASNPPDAEDVDSWLREEYPAAKQYANDRQEYIRLGKGKPPSG